MRRRRSCTGGEARSDVIPRPLRSAGGGRWVMCTPSPLPWISSLPRCWQVPLPPYITIYIRCCWQVPLPPYTTIYIRCCWQVPLSPYITVHICSAQREPVRRLSPPCGMRYVCVYVRRRPQRAERMDADAAASLGPRSPTPLWLPNNGRQPLRKARTHSYVPGAAHQLPRTRLHLRI